MSWIALTATFYSLLITFLILSALLGAVVVVTIIGKDLYEELTDDSPPPDTFAAGEENASDTLDQSERWISKALETLAAARNTPTDVEQGESSSAEMTPHSGVEAGATDDSPSHVLDIEGDGSLAIGDGEAHLEGELSTNVADAAELDASGSATVGGNGAAADSEVSADILDQAGMDVGAGAAAGDEGVSAYGSVTARVMSILGLDLSLRTAPTGPEQP